MTKKTVLVRAILWGSLLTCILSNKASAAPLDSTGYADLLRQATSAMEAGQIAAADTALQSAEASRPTDPTLLLTRATLYLRAGRFDDAARLFSRVRADFPADSLARWGGGLADLGRGAGDIAVFDTLANTLAPTAALLPLYMRLLYGDKSAVWSATRTVTVAEPDPLRLELAAFAALRVGDTVRGETLLRALLSRPVMSALIEDNALTLPFQANQPIAAAGIWKAAPPSSIVPNLSGQAALSPEKTLPAGVRFVTYRIAGSHFVATTNVAPFTTTWDTTTVANGVYTLQITSVGATGKVLRESRRIVSVVNGGASPTLTAGDDREIRARLLTLLTPHLSRKAAYFALAERAAAQGNSTLALAAIEAVVAIDPTFQNAEASLQHYNLAMIGPREGIWRAATTDKVVALTFDDGPNPLPDHTPALLDALRAAHVPATFFVVGSQAERATYLLRRMSADGHEVANHSYSHPNLTRITAADVQRELCRTSVIIRSATGKRPHFFRPPGGNFNTTVVAAAESLGMAGAYWTVDALPFESAPHTPDQLTRYVLGNLRPGAIILMHNAPANTVAALSGIVRGLRARGYTIVTMSELIRHHQAIVAKH